MKEKSLRMRVKEIQETDPGFFELMLLWRDEFNERKKLWLDKRIQIKQRDMMTGKIVKQTFTIEDSLNLMWEVYNDDEDWGYVLA